MLAIFEQASEKRPNGSLREKRPNTEFFWSVFSPNAGKYRPEKTPCLDTFHAVNSNVFVDHKWLQREVVTFEGPMMWQ